MNLAAEMQWDMLLPPLGFASPELAIAGMLEPAYLVAGDAFDYSLNGDVLDFAILDAMGHGVNSTLASTLALGAFRFGRRRQLALTVVAELIDDALIERFDGDEFVTGNIGQLDIATGLFRWVNAGHPLPLLVRRGAVRPIGSYSPMLGAYEAAEWSRTSLALEHSDVLVLFTDGVFDAVGAAERFGEERLERTLTGATDAQDAVARIDAALSAFAVGKQTDDTAILAVQRIAVAAIASHH